MFHPVGPEPSSVYWRRRIALLISLVALVVLIGVTVGVLLTNDPGSPAAAGADRSSTPAATRTTGPASSTATTSYAPPSSSSHASATRGSSTTPVRSSASSSIPPAPCSAASLGLAASTDRSSYHVGDQPVLSILVTNRGTTPCVQDLADPQIVLRVYNGASRVWGSHDCKIEPGTNKRTLAAGATVRVSIVWSGLSSQPKCAGTRQRVGAGTYTLYASLSGHDGTAAQFAIR
jgi:hypothetical protein